MFTTNPPPLTPTLTMFWFNENFIEISTDERDHFDGLKDKFIYFTKLFLYRRTTESVENM